MLIVQLKVTPTYQKKKVKVDKTKLKQLFGQITVDQTECQWLEMQEETDVSLICLNFIYSEVCKSMNKI